MITPLRHFLKKIEFAPLLSEVTPLRDLKGRVLAADVQARFDEPGYDESTRDGFAIAGEDLDSYQLIQHEAYAGNTHGVVLEAGQACAIMTGGLIPEGTTRVIPKEHVLVKDGRVEFNPLHPLLGRADFMCRRGTYTKKGDTVLKVSTPIKAGHLALLANSGITEAEVYQKPKVAIFTSGTELEELSDVAPPKGHKVASNGLLLSALVDDFGGIPHYLGVVKDEPQSVENTIRAIDHNDYGIMISTGGMGPGRYDLTTDAFIAAGGHVIATSLPIMPGRFCLIGQIGRTIFFGLPGTPSSAQPLFMALIAPILLRLQGLCRDRKEDEVDIAEIAQAAPIRHANLPTICPCALSFQGGRVLATPLPKGSIGEAYMVVPEETEMLVVGQRVELLSWR